MAPVKLQLNELQAKALLEAKAKTINALSLFRPAVHQEEFFETFSLDMILEILLGGGNRAGKSLCAAAAMAAFLKNEPITFHDGRKVYMRPERWRNEAVKVWILGYDWRHIGKTIYRLLFKADAFRIIFDKKTGKLRAWNPANAEDRDLIHLTKPAPPFIVGSDIVGGINGISWENKKENQVLACDLAHDGTRVEFFASTGAKPQGDPAHLIWMDEAISDESWYSELLIRLADHRGRLFWTTWPTTAPSAAMSEAFDRAQQQRGKANRKTFAFRFKGSDNPFTKGEHRDAILATMDEDTRAARDDGALGTERWRVYARFSKWVHRVLGPDPVGDDPLAKAVREHNGIPSDWTRYLILDPGTANPAVLMVAVPPPSLGDFIVPYDELYLHYTPAKPLAEAIAAKTKGTVFEDFIIDSHGARQTPMGFDGTVGENYEKEFAAVGLRCRRRGSMFSFGSDNVPRRIMGVQGTLNLRHDSTPRLRVFGCDVLIRQLENYRWKADPRGNPTDKPDDYQKIDVAQCLEYFVSREDCGYVPPPQSKVEDKRSPDTVMKSLRAIFGSQPKADDKSVYCGVGSRPI